MTFKQSLPMIPKVAAQWALLGMNLVGLYFILAQIFMPSIISRKFSNSVIAMSGIASQTPPYSWFRLSPEQVVFVTLAMNVVNLVALLSWPKLAGLLAIGGAITRQYFLRHNEDNPALPNSPLCGYLSPHCGLLDLLHFGIAVCGLVVFMSDLPLPEMSMKLLHMWGLPEMHFLNRWVADLRRWLPKRPMVHMPSIPSITSTGVHKEPPAQGIAATEAARKNI